MNRFPQHALFALVFSTVATLASAAEVTLTRVPEGGLQPQAALGRDGTVHLIYFRGEPKAGDIFYVRRPPGHAQFSDAVPVNSQAGSAIAIGTIRGAQLAIGKGGRVHVAWNGSGDAAAHEGAPLLYTRLNDEGVAFEPQRDLMTFTSSLDGGGSVAADDKGHVYVAWHARPDGKSQAETDRAVFIAVSSNEGRTFATERQANTEPTGACGCCGMKAYADAQGAVYLLYREARGGIERGATILVSQDGAAAFRSLHTHPWKATTCPMSSAWLGPGKSRTLAAWETEGRVWFSTIDPHLGKVGRLITPTSDGDNQKHPVAVTNKLGQTLLVWTEGTRWMKGGALAWQIFDESGQPTDKAGRVDGLPVWSLAAAFLRPDGDFEIIY